LNAINGINDINEPNEINETNQKPKKRKAREVIPCGPGGGIMEGFYEAIISKKAKIFYFSFS